MTQRDPFRPRLPAREQGFAPIDDYGVLGDGRTLAMVALDGQVDWWPLPAMDSAPVFAALLDPGRGGCIQLAPTAPFTVERRYVGDSNVLETTFQTSTGAVRVTDALTSELSGAVLPWGELVRRVEGLNGAVELTWAVRPGSRFGSVAPWVQEVADSIVVHCGNQHLALRCFDIGSAQVAPREVTGRFTSAPGSVGVLALTASDDGPVYLPDRAALEARLAATVRRWHEWSSTMRYDGPWAEAVRRSGLVLKLLQYGRTGAIAAAGTTSLPERIGGDKNWDYRYMWIRDAAYSVDACLRLGLVGEVQAAVAFLLRSVRATLPGLKVFYNLDGTVPQVQVDLDAVGYRHSRPVRAGNRAATQTQLGTYGDLFDAVWRYVEDGHVLDPSSGVMLAGLADSCCDGWRSKDSGIWELAEQQHYTISKIGCWVALDRALSLHQRGQIPTLHAERWKNERDAVKAWIETHCWSEKLRAYTFYPGTERLDASVLLAGQTGFDRGERLAGTIVAVQEALARGALVYRYSGMEEEEGAFLAGSFWMVSALASIGRPDEARDLMDEAVAFANDLGLMAEQMDPRTGAMLGNVPQGLSHLALINAAHAVQSAQQDRNAH